MIYHLRSQKAEKESRTILQTVLNYSDSLVAWYATVCHLRMGSQGGHVNIFIFTTC